MPFHAGVSDRRDGRCLVGCVGAVAILCIVGFIISRSGTSPASPNETNNIPSTVAEPRAGIPTPAPQQVVSLDSLPEYSIGQEFSVGYFSYMVGKVEVTSDPSDPTNAPVLAVFMNVRNDDTSDSISPPIKLIDESGQVVAGTMLETGHVLLTEFQPGVVNRGFVLFEKIPVVNSKAGASATVAGNLNHASTTNHHTPVTLQVTDIEP
jgi:hypothetical protein